MEFYGRFNSYVEIFNCGKLDVRYFIIFLIWVYYNGCKGLIVNYNLNGYGVYLWMMSYW